MNKKILKTIIIIVFTLLFSSTTYANETINDSQIRKSNALENTLSFNNLINPIQEKTTEIILVPESDLKKLENILENEKFSISMIEEATNNLNKRSGIKTFFIGNNLGILKFQLIQIKDQEYVLTNLSEKITDTENINLINKKIEFLKEKQVEITTFINKQEKKFSLFGWLVNFL
jgi:hypothetical protein